MKPRRLGRRVAPPNFADPWGLVLRLLRTRDPAATFALWSTLASTVLTPLDVAFAVRERRLYARADAPHGPIVLVTGAPRSGTTLVSQVLIAHLPVTYFNNLTALFPRAPIVANQLFRSSLRPAPTSYRSFYGRTNGLAAENDGLHLWDRWMGLHRWHPPDHLALATEDAMRRFFGAYEAAFGRPVLNKNNGIATCAAVVARALPSARFLFVRRDPAFTVQSILGAREMIQGSRARPYGVDDPGRARGTSAGPIEDVAAQVLYHERRIEEQIGELGAERCWTVEYEAFCREPYRLVERIASEILDVSLDRDALRVSLPAFHDHNRLTVGCAEFAAIEAALAGLRTVRVAREARM